MPKSSGLAPIIAFGIIILFIGLIILTTTLYSLEKYRLDKVRVPWWMYAIIVIGFGIFILGLFMIIMGIISNDIVKKVCDCSK